MEAFRIVHVEIGPSPIQAESKFGQIGPIPVKDNPRKRLGFPWISLSELSLFKDLRGPPGPEISSAPLPPLRSTELQWHMRRRNAALLVSAGPSDVAQVIHHPHCSDGFEFWQAIFRKSSNILITRTTSTALIALAVGYDQFGASERSAGGFSVMDVLVTAIHVVRRIERRQVSTRGQNPLHL